MVDIRLLTITVNKSKDFTPLQLKFILLKNIFDKLQQIVL